MANQMLASQDAHFTNRVTGEKLEAFRQHRKAENQFPDPLLDEASEISYCFLSIGEGGLGLSLSYDIITQGHGGTLTLESASGEGTTFIIALPTREDKNTGKTKR